MAKKHTAASQAAPSSDKTASYRLLCRFRRGGEVFQPGAVVELTAQEAAEFGKLAVALGKSASNLGELLPPNENKPDSEGGA